MNMLALPFIGFLIGLLIISLGGGGGGIYVGILTAFFNIPPAVAAATSLATIIPTTVIGTVSHWRAGNVNVKLGLIMMGGAVAGAVIGSLFSDALPKEFYNKITGILLLVLAVQMVRAYIRKRRGGSGQGTAKNSVSRADVAKAVFFGLLGGVMSGLVGVSGTTPVVAGLATLGCGALEMVGTSVFVLVGISLTGFLIHLGLGNVHWALVGCLAAGTMCGAFLAPVMLKRISRETLERWLPPVLIVLTAVMGFIVLMK
jgi:uncharacterized membrane protein YfcA